MGDQDFDGELLAGAGRQNKPNNRMLLFDVTSGAAFENRPTTI